MPNYNEIARRFAIKQGCDVVQPTTATRNGYRYFYLDCSERPRYTGNPYIIKVSPTGKVLQVLNLSEIFWAFNQRITTDGQSV